MRTGKIIMPFTFNVLFVVVVVVVVVVTLDKECCSVHWCLRSINY